MVSLVGDDVMVFLRQKPREYLGVGIGVAPGVVLVFGIDGQSGIAALFDLVALINKAIGAGGLSLAAARIAQELLTEMTELFGFVREDTVDAELVAWIEERIAARAAAKREKNYAEADAIRAELSARGVTLRDTAQGTTYTVEK